MVYWIWLFTFENIPSFSFLSSDIADNCNGPGLILKLNLNLNCYLWTDVAALQTEFKVPLLKKNQLSINWST